MPEPDDHAVARLLAEEAGERLLALRSAGNRAGDSAWALRDEGDRTGHRFLVERLAELRPADAVLSEEGDERDGPLGEGRLAVRRVWIVDPLDGTREFGEPGREDWAVHVALAVDGVPVVGAVALPARGLVLGTEPPEPLPPAPTGPIRIVVSRSRPPSVARRVAAALGAELVPLGSAGAKGAAVVLGEADAYLHDGGQYEWDSCAPAAVALAAGLVATRLDGSPLRYNRPDPYLPDLLIAHPACAPAIRAAIDAPR